ncbi:MAG: hypothetical protein J7J94_00595, partial [Thaumarchaeota archaeon]|nr:hypothetical protein [Nitrososphaerota archaeon]
DYQKLADRIEKELGLPISYEGRYKWIAFLPSKLNPEKPVNNRYFGVFEDGEIKYRGIEARRRDTPKIVKKMQLELLEKLAEASSPEELRQKALECLEIYRRYVKKLILGDLSIGDLAITRVLSMPLREYSVRARHALAAKSLERLGIKTEPGESGTYVITKSGATAIQLLESHTYDVEIYLKILRNAAETILTPLIHQDQM